MIAYKRFALSDYKDSLIVTDEKIAELYSIKGGNVYLLPQGEAAKTFERVQMLCEWFLDKNLQRGDSVVAIGGGSIGDTVGFACSVYKRGGAKLTHVPTTLLAQIDSSIGGKTAINLDGIKNAVGSFYSADTVIDANFLKTLDDKQILNGRGELTKYRMLSRDIDKSFDGEITERVIRACVDYKQSLCAVDPYDRNKRRILNFGHTVGHGLELTYSLPHGVAVANGLYYESLLALKLGRCDAAYFDKWSAEIENSFAIYPITDQVVKCLLNDKKNVDNKIGFVLPTEFEEVFLTEQQVKSFLC